MPGAMVYCRYLLACLFLCSGATAHGETANDGDFLISQDFSFAEQSAPAIAVGWEGQFAVVWVDYRYGNGDIFCRLYDSGAVPAGDEFILTDDGADAWQFEPDLASDWFGNYFAVWRDYRNSMYPFNPDVYYQRLDSVGIVGANLNVTVEHPDSSHQSPAIAAAGWGKTVVAWTDLRYRNWDVFVQSLDGEGNPVGGNQRVNDDISNTPQHEPDVAMSAEGWFVVAWYDGRNGDDDIYLQKFDSAGIPVGPNIRVNDDGGAAKQKFPSVAVGGNDVIYVVWTDYRNGSYPRDPDIFGQRFDGGLNRLGYNFLVNLDGTRTAQRDPGIAADRMGNACVVWADSSGPDWDIKGQMIEHTGRLRGGNFPVNLDAIGKQLHPDVALDGYFLYCTWADDRNANYDIYGRVIEYNTPTLIANPAIIEVTRDRLDPDPVSVMVRLSNAGYGELDFRLVAEQSWIALSATTGRTPDSFEVAINSGSLGYGTHQGRIRLIDLQHSDSTAFIPVMVTITGPLIDTEPDTLYFRALSEIGSPPPQNFIIRNAGSGNVNWRLAPTADWVTTDKAAGSDEELVSVTCDISSLITGRYEGAVVVTDSTALNSPESVLVILTVESNTAYLAAWPAAVSDTLTQGDTVTDSIRIRNPGGSALSWRATSGAEWMALDADSGSDNDNIVYTLSAGGVEPGIYFDSILVRDTLAFNNPLVIPVTLAVHVNDTVLIAPAQVETGGQGQTRMHLITHNTLRQGLATLKYDTTLLRLDSLIICSGDSFPGTLTADIDPAAGCFTVRLAAAPAGGEIAPGKYHASDIYFAAVDSAAGTTVFEAVADSCYVELADGTIRAPILSIGEIDISAPTVVAGPEESAVPVVFYLDQNFPNPFNSSTTISYSLERSGPVRVAVYNILGQLVAPLVDDFRPAGRHTVSWNGRDDAGREMASGIYFYRLRTPGYSAVKKMVLLK